MKIYRKIDKDGMFIEDVVVEPIIVPDTPNKDGSEEYPPMDKYHIDTEVPDGIHKPRWNGQKWVETENKTVLQGYKETARLQTLKNQIQDAIYAFYPKEKQDEDQGWKVYWESYIVGVSHNSQGLTSISTDELVSDIIAATAQVHNNRLTIDTYVMAKPELFSEGYRKLIKISLKYLWLKTMLDEWRLALSDQRQPKFPKFPSLKDT